MGRNDRSIIRAPVMLIDVDLLRPYTGRTATSGEGEDLYFDVLPRIERENLRRIKCQQSSILNAYFLSGPVVDFGTPIRLFELRNNYQQVLHATNP